MRDIKEINLGTNTKLTLIQSDKFKSNLVSIYIQRLLDRKEATKTALLPAIMTTGCEKYKNQIEMTKRIDDLYGASISGDVIKRGEKQILVFRIISTNEKYLDEKIFKKVVEFLNEIVNNPLVVDGGFDEKTVQVEKENLGVFIDSIINDKGRYSIVRCFEEMYKDTRFSINEYGYKEDLDSINGKVLYEQYKNIIKNSKIDIVVEGDFHEDEVVDVIKSGFSFEQEEVKHNIEDEKEYKVTDVNVINEHMDIKQGKLVMGYRTNIDYKDTKKYYALAIGCNILGGGASSKMFNNIREKESLCYSIYSAVEKYKKAMIVSAGIEVDNYDKVVELVKKEVQDMKDGNITKEELENSKIAITSSIKSMGDSIGGMSDFYFGQMMNDMKYTVEDVIQNVENVTVESIIESFKSVELDTIYFLRG